MCGNLCRCTGYVGIVEAVQSALKTAQASRTAARRHGRKIGPVGSHPPATPKDFLDPAAAGAAKSQAARTVVENFDAVEWAPVERDGVELRQSFSSPSRAPRSGDFSPISIR